MNGTIITKVPGFKGQEFTEPSQKKLCLSDAIQHARERNSILISLPEAAALTIETDQDIELRTRTCAVYFRRGHEYCIAFDDETDTAKNILIARASEGLAQHKRGHLWTLPMNDLHIAQILERAKQKQRILTLPRYEPENIQELTKQELFKQTSMNEESPLELKTNAGDPRLELRVAGKVLLGDSIEPFAKHIHSLKQDTFSIYVMQPSYFGTAPHLELKPDMAAVFSTTFNRREISALETFGGEIIPKENESEKEKRERLKNKVFGHKSYYGDGAYGGHAIGKITK